MFFVCYLGNLLLFKKDLVSFLEKKDKELISYDVIEGEQDYSEAVVKERRLESGPEVVVVKESPPFQNPTDSPIEEKWSYTITYERGTEHSQTKGSGWSMNVEFAPSLEILGVEGSMGSLGGVYDRHKENTATKHELKTIEEPFERSVHIPPKSKVVAKYVVITKKFRCQVENITVKFNSLTKVKCKVRKKNTQNVKPKLYKLCEILDTDHNRSKVSAECKLKVSSEYEWTEAVNEIRFDEKAIDEK